jgi:hypothetical protein
MPFPVSSRLERIRLIARLPKALDAAQSSENPRTDGVPNVGSPNEEKKRSPSIKHHEQTRKPNQNPTTKSPLIARTTGLLSAVMLKWQLRPG